MKKLKLKTEMLRSRKATGSDDVPAELFKAGGETEYVWRSGKLVSGQKNGRSPHSSHFPRKVILKSVKPQHNCSDFPCKQDPSSDHTGKDPSEDLNRNSRRVGGIRQGRGTRDQASLTSRRRSTLSVMISSG